MGKYREMDKRDLSIHGTSSLSSFGRPHTDKKKSIETFGSYIHSYKFNEAVKDKVILDLRYEARNVEQYLGKREKIDEWFDTKTKGLSSVARAA